MIPSDLDIIGIVAAVFDGDELHVRFKLSDGRVSETYWTTEDLRTCGTPFDDDGQPRPSQRTVLQ